MLPVQFRPSAALNARSAHMSPLLKPAATGLRRLSELAEAAGGCWTDNTLHLPASVGTGFIKLLAPEPGLTLAIHHYVLAHDFVLHRLADETAPETLLFSFYAFGPASRTGALLSTAQIASTNLEFTTTLPAQTDILLVALAIEKSLLATWLPGAAGLPPALSPAPHLLVLDTLLTPELQAVLREVTVPQPAHYLDAFFYKIKVQELLYWLFRELGQRATAPPRPLHPADVARIFQVRTALLASLRLPPNLPTLAQAAGLSETKMRQLFRHIFGSSLYDYYQAARMAEARHLLEQVSVSEAGHQLGFTNLSHFARLFAQHHGLTPKKYQATLADNARQVC